MILSWLLAPILSMMTAVIGTLPDTPGGTPFGGYSSPNFGSYFHTANYFVPIPLMVWCIGALVAFTVAVFVFQLAQWAYRELPDLWGFGPS
jgi:hypothetical protein